MRWFFVLIVVLISDATLNCTYSLAQGFREVKWGVTKADVIKSEGKPEEELDTEDGHSFLYSRTVAGKEKVITDYVFKNNRLQMGSYIIGGLNRGELQELFKNLSKKYGKAEKYYTEDHRIRYHWLKGDTRVTLHKGIFFDSNVVTYYYNPYYVTTVGTARKKRAEGL